MSSYPLVNRRGKDLKYYVYHVGDPMIKGMARDAPNGFLIKNPGALGFSMAATIPGGYGVGTAPDNSTIEIRGDRDQQWIMLEGGALVGPYTFESGKHHVVVSGAPEGMVVSVENMTVALQAHLDGVVHKRQQRDGEDDPDAILLMVGTALLKAFTVGLAAMGAPTELAAGMSDVIGDLVSSGIDEPPAAPRIEEIKAAIQDVVQEESAKESASLFTDTLAWLTATQRLVANRKATGATISEQQAKDFSNLVDSALNQTTDASFVGHLGAVRDNSEVAQYIIPNFIAAIGVYVQLRRIKLGRMYLPLRVSDPNYLFPEPELTEFISDLGGYKRGLEDAAQVFARTRDGLVEDTRLNGTPEAIIPIKLVTKHYLGDEFACRDEGYARTHPNGGWGPNSAGYGSNPDLVETALSSLEQTLDNLQKDVTAVNAGQWPTYLLDYRADGEPPA